MRMQDLHPSWGKLPIPTRDSKEDLTTSFAEDEIPNNVELHLVDDQFRKQTF